MEYLKKNKVLGTAKKPISAKKLESSINDKSIMKKVLDSVMNKEKTKSRVKETKVEKGGIKK